MDPDSLRLLDDLERGDEIEVVIGYESRQELVQHFKGVFSCIRGMRCHGRDCYVLRLRNRNRADTLLVTGLIRRIRRTQLD